MRGWPFLGSLRMLSLGFFPDRQVTYGFGLWPSRGKTKLFLSDLHHKQFAYASAARRRILALTADKVRFAELVSSVAVTPKLLAVIELGRVLLTSGDVPTPDPDGLIAAAHIYDGLVFKPRKGEQGKGIFLLLPSDGQALLNRELVEPAAFEKRIRKLDSYIVTSRVRQGKFAAGLFPKTANTLRIVTMIDPKNGEAFIARAVQRIGTEASFPVDNYACGGLYSYIDIQSGRLSAATSGEGLRRATHPDSGTQIEGAIIPRWRETVNSILRLAQRLDFIDIIGWDIALTDEGFVVIEGNGNPQPHQRASRPLLADERVRTFYRHHLSLRGQARKQ